MSTPKRISFSDTSSQKLPSEDVSTKKMKKKRLASSVIKRIWNEDDELSILKGLVDYRVKTRHHPSFDWDGFFHLVQGSIHVKFSKEQLFSKVRKLRRKFVAHMERIDRGDDPLFTRLTDSQAFGYSNMIWGANQAEVATNGGTENAQEEPQGVIQEDTQGGIEKARKEAQSHEDNGGNLLGDKTMEDINPGKESELAKGRMENVMRIESGEDGFRENGRVGDDEPVKENGAEKAHFDGKSLHEVGVDKINGKERHDDDEFRIVEDAFETTILQGLSGWQRKLQLKKLMMNLEMGKRKELSNEWEALCSEEVKLKIKKLRFAAKLLDAANDG